MARNESISIEPSTTPHPGEIINEHLDYHGWSQRELARRTGLTPKTISVICNGKASITASTALVLERVLQRPVHFWLNLQRQFDEADVRRSDRIQAEMWREWASKFPLREMRDRKFTLPSATSDVDLLLRYLGVSSPKSWQSVWDTNGVVFRQTREFPKNISAIAAWVRETEIVASEIQTSTFSERLLRSFIPEIKCLTRSRVSTAVDELQGLCAEAGVAVVFVPELPSTGISGCARWLSSKKALIGLSLRYKTDDQMWFSFFHEMGHLLLHKTIRSFVLDNVTDDLNDKVVDLEMESCEEEANRFAAETLIPPMELAAFVRDASFTNDSIFDFAEKVNIAPGIVVGRLQHIGILEHYQGNKLKQNLSWNF